MKKLIVTCKCPNCGTAVPITKRDAALALRVDVKPHSTEHYKKAGAKGAAARWGKTA